MSDTSPTADQHEDPDVVISRELVEVSEWFTRDERHVHPNMRTAAQEFLDFWRRHRNGPTVPSGLRLTMRGGTEQVSVTFNVDDATATASLQFTDDHGDATDGPLDSVTQAPIVPVVQSDDTGVLNPATGTPGDAPGSYVYALTPGVAGTANISVAPLENSDGSAVDNAAGDAFPTPAAVSVDVTPGPAGSMVLSVNS
jgi:hypothetical protein